MKHVKYAIITAIILTVSLLMGMTAAATLAPGVNGEDMTPDMPSDTSNPADTTDDVSESDETSALDGATGAPVETTGANEPEQTESGIGIWGIIIAILIIAAIVLLIFAFMPKR